MKRHQNYFCLFFILCLMLELLPGSGSAQKKAPVDNGYYIVYPEKLLLRMYLSQKFAPFTISAPGNDRDLNYKTNAKLNLGIGVTYNKYTFNIAYGFSFLNKDKGRGNTKGLDLQFHLFPHKLSVDLLGTFRRSYYLDPKDNNGLHLTSYYIRPDLKRDIIGAAVFKVPNSGKFSYRAALTQKEKQTRSAGSLLYGGEAYYGTIKGDSSLVPSLVSNNFPQAGINQINFFSIGPGIGYAYTWVLGKNFFITGSAIGGVHFNFSTEERTTDKHKKFSVIPSGVYKGAIGYNGDEWAISAIIVGNALYVGSASSSKEYFIPTGGLRLILTKKIGLKSNK